MSIEANKVLIGRWVDVWRRQDKDLVDILFAPDYTVNDTYVGIDGVQQAIQLFHTGLSGLALELHEIVAEGDKVVARWTVYGIHTGEFFGVPPTHKPLVLRGINIYQVVGGKIVANQEQTNIPEILQQLLRKEYDAS